MMRTSRGKSPYAPTPLRPYAPALHKLLLNVGDEIPDVGTAIQQFVEPRHDLFSRCGIALQGGVPFARRRLELRVHFAELLLKTFLRGLEARFQRGKIASRGFRFAKLVQRLIQLENFFEQLRRGLLLVPASFARAFDAQKIFAPRTR